jgi:NAD-dependent deacetylase
VDNLHQNSGISDDLVIELHGNNSYAKCLECDQRYELRDLQKEFEEFLEVKPCRECGGIIKTATISFGQSMPEYEMQRSQELVEHCDLIIVLGSSLTVYPAAGFPEYAKRNGASLAIVNREETPLDSIADVVVHEQIGSTMAMVVGLN